MPDLMVLLFVLPLWVILAFIGPYRLQLGFTRMFQRIIDYWEVEPTQGVVEPEDPPKPEPVEIDWKKVEDERHVDWATHYIRLALSKPELMTDVDWKFALAANLISKENYLEYQLAKVGVTEGHICNPCARGIHDKCKGLGIAGKRRPCECDCGQEFDGI